MATGETLEFTVDPAILHSIIQAQAGTLPKALMEAVMNAIDASATGLSVKLDAYGFTFSDDGRGFQSREEIEKWFARFGTPHKEGDATYGKFRMGRGQLMAFSSNIWRTGRFEMNVDIKVRGMNFGFKEKLRPRKGCQITGKLYSPLSSSELADTVAEFIELVKFAQIPVRLNGKVVSKNPKDLKWDLETPEAYIKVDREKSLSVYNLGVLVRTFENWAYGCGGIIVTKQPVMVNFARNDILTSQCNVWRRISKFFKDSNVRKVANRSSLNKDERRFLAKQYAHGDIKDIGIDPLHLKLITDVTGRHHSLHELMCATLISSATEKQARTGSKLHRQGSAFVIAPETLARFNACNLADLLDILKSAAGLTHLPQTIGFDELAADFSEDYQTFKVEELPLDEQLAFKAVQMSHVKFFSWYKSAEKSTGIRELRIGESNVAGAWTDGNSYIVLGLTLVKKAVKRGASGFMELLTVLLHEYVHDDSDLESHDHDLVFYNKFHDLLIYGGSAKLMAMSLDLEKAYAKLVQKEGVLPEKRITTCVPVALYSRPRLKTLPPVNESDSRQLNLI